ncbi:MAG: asparagine synthase (glutamine-hydrolyzing) [Candidatus Lindowbacteria bacterium]|nr:asparagine synthase (glutamine-hydrolyzing) [Candidatus Lindowbacteria bacterium]
MCGITGFFAFSGKEKIEKKLLFDMTELLAHRGPDDRGCVLINDADHCSFKTLDEAGAISEAPVGFGHRRLSILDLSPRGHQPMAIDDKKVWLVFNGEIYNFIELKNELIGLGHGFDSNCDTEVVLRAYMEWGTGCFAKFNGMWALAIYDDRSSQMVLSRDRYGKKPLYFYQNSDFLLFASEPKSLFLHGSVPKEINPRKVLTYAGRHYRYVDSDCESFFKDINQIEPSSFRVINSDGSFQEETYWKLKPGSNLEDEFSESEIVDQFRELLKDSVSLRLRSDVPVGSMLSGGMDSTSVTTFAVQDNSNFTSFSGVTGDGYYDETEYIKEVVDSTGVNSVFIYPQAVDLFPTLNEMLQFHDEPVCTVTWYSLYLLTRKVSEYNIPVILTGHGGDELLGGYWDHYHYNFSDLRDQGSDDTSEHDAWMSNHNRNPEEYGREKDYVSRLKNDRSIEIDKYSQYLDYLTPSLLDQKSDPALSSPFEGELSRRMYIELMHETVRPSLRAEDRNSMAFSIENRVPFLDYRLAEFCYRLPNKYKIRNGLGKWLLREAMKGLLPEKVRMRKDKTGHNAPADKWWRDENRAELEDLMSRKSFVNSEIYDIRRVKELFQEHCDGANHYMFFWQYINLNLWYDQFWKD